MTDPAPITDEIACLGELAALGMGLARRLHDAAQATDDLEALARLGTAYHHVSRGIRQSLVLKMRFASGWVPRAPKVAAQSAASPAPVAAAPPPERTAWNEYERFDDDELIDDLDGLSDLPEHEPVDSARLEAALESGVARLRRGVLALRQRPAPKSAPQRSAPYRPAARPGAGPLAHRPDAGPAARRANLMSGAASLRLADTS